MPSTASPRTTTDHAATTTLIQDMRGEMWRWLETTFPPGARLIDLGCGTGLDAVHLAEAGISRLPQPIGRP